MKYKKIKFYKIFFIVIFLFFISLNFPLLDWFLHSEKIGGYFFELNPDTSFLFSIYKKQGILDETVGFIHSMTYSSKWMHICYHLYNFLPCFDSHPCFACCSVFLIPMTILAVKDLKSQKKKNFHKTLIFYIIPSVIVLTICIYGFFIYTPQYYNRIDDIVSSV